MTGTADGGAVIQLAEAADLASARELLLRCGLDDQGLANTVMFVARTTSVLVGTVALESHGASTAPVFLLRSVAVDPAVRGSGVGAQLVSVALRRIDAACAPVALLTETAAGFFPRFGFAQVARADLPAALADSAQLQGACPASAVAMLRPPAVTSPTAAR